MPAHERRRSPRLVLERVAHGKLRSAVPVHVLDLSGDGMQLEVSSSLRPGSLYELQASVNGIPLAAVVRITRCKAGGYASDGHGGKLLVFRAGAEFVSLEGEHAGDFRDWVQAFSA